MGSQRFDGRTEFHRQSDVAPFSIVSHLNRKKPLDLDSSDDLPDFSQLRFVEQRRIGLKHQRDAVLNLLGREHLQYATQPRRAIFILDPRIA